MFWVHDKFGNPKIKKGPTAWTGLTTQTGPSGSSNPSGSSSPFGSSNPSWSSNPFHPSWSSSLPILSRSSYLFDNSTRESRMWGWVRLISNSTYFEGIWISTNLANWNPSKKCLHLKCFLISLSKQSISLQRNLNS